MAGDQRAGYRINYMSWGAGVCSLCNLSAPEPTWYPYITEPLWQYLDTNVPWWCCLQWYNTDCIMYCSCSYIDTDYCYSVTDYTPYWAILMKIYVTEKPQQRTWKWWVIFTQQCEANTPPQWYVSIFFDENGALKTKTDDWCVYEIYCDWGDYLCTYCDIISMSYDDAYNELSSQPEQYYNLLSCDWHLLSSDNKLYIKWYGTCSDYWAYDWCRCTYIVDWSFLRHELLYYCNCSRFKDCTTWWNGVPPK